MAGVKRWKRRREQGHIQREREKARRQLSAGLAAESQPRHRSTGRWWKTTRFWRHLQSQVNVDFWNNKNGDERSTHAQESESHSSSSPFESESSVSTSQTDRLRPASTWSREDEEEVLPSQSGSSQSSYERLRASWQRRLNRIQHGDDEAEETTPSLSLQPDKKGPASTILMLHKHESPPSSTQPEGAGPKASSSQSHSLPGPLTWHPPDRPPRSPPCVRPDADHSPQTQDAGSIAVSCRPLAHQKPARKVSNLNVPDTGSVPYLSLDN